MSGQTGSGLCTDNASNTDLGGWQSTIHYQGQSWPMALISYYPVYCFDYSRMGYLNSAAYIAPFMPIECYSGWLQDGSFGGPSAEGVNRYQGNQQLCTWRNLP